jgi:hypothetical protein
MKKREIRKLAKELYKEGKTRQETFDILITKVKKPITYTADVLRYHPPSLSKKKYNIIYWLLISLVIISESLLIIYNNQITLEINSNRGSIIVFPFQVFFHKSFYVIDLIWVWLGTLFGGLSLTINEYYIFPFLIWVISLSFILINHFRYNLNYFYLIIFYYLYSSIFYLFPTIGITADKGFSFLSYISIIEFLLSILILSLTIYLKKKMAPKYLKKQTAYLDKSGKKRMKLLIKFND